MAINWNTRHSPKGISRKERDAMKAHAEALCDAFVSARDAARQERTAAARRLAVDANRVLQAYLTENFPPKDYNAQARIARQQAVRKGNAEWRARNE